MKRTLIAFSALFVVCAQAEAQTNDMIGVSWTGTTYNVSSSTGAAAALGSTGLPSNNCMASTPSGTIYSIANWGATLVDINPTTGNPNSTSPTGLVDIRGLAYDPASGLLYAIENVVLMSTSTIDELWTLDPNTLAINFIGQTGRTGIQGLALHQGVLYAYDCCVNGIGLVTIDPATGVATDVNPNVGPGTANQFLTSDGNTLYLGRSELLIVDPITAAETLVGPTGVDLRGCDFKMTAPPGCLGQNYCTAAVPNSTGLPGRICATGSLVITANNFFLTASDLPPGQFGYFLGSQTQGFFMPPGSAGFVCLSSNIGRFNQPGNVGQGPTFTIQVNLTSIPVNPPQPVLPGDIWNFQCWYRDVMNQNNFTDAVSVQF